ncbi:hypothetical protein ACOSQ2_031253 [Xanthoceras sorbifolium]
MKLGRMPPPRLDKRRRLRFFQKSGFLEEIQKPRISGFQKSGRRPHLMERRRLLLLDPDGGGVASSICFFFNC